jgi:hypothetical protein
LLCRETSRTDDARHRGQVRTGPRPWAAPALSGPFSWRGAPSAAAPRTPAHTLGRLCGAATSIAQPHTADLSTRSGEPGDVPSQQGVGGQPALRPPLPVVLLQSGKDRSRRLPATTSTGRVPVTRRRRVDSSREDASRLRAPDHDGKLPSRCPRPQRPIPSSARSAAPGTTRRRPIPARPTRRAPRRVSAPGSSEFDGLTRTRAPPVDLRRTPGGTLWLAVLIMESSHVRSGYFL